MNNLTFQNSFHNFYDSYFSLLQAFHDIFSQKKTTDNCDLTEKSRSYFSEFGNVETSWALLSSINTNFEKCFCFSPYPTHWINRRTEKLEILQKAQKYGKCKEKSEYKMFKIRKELNFLYPFMSLKKLHFWKRRQTKVFDWRRSCKNRLSGKKIIV